MTPRFFLVHQQESLCRRGDLVFFGPNAVSVIVKNAEFSLAELTVKRGIDLVKILIAQNCERCLDFLQSTHASILDWK